MKDYRIIYIVDGITDDWSERNKVNLQALDEECEMNDYLGGIIIKYRVLKRNAQGKWTLYAKN